VGLESVPGPAEGDVGDTSVVDQSVDRVVDGGREVAHGREVGKVEVPYLDGARQMRGSLARTRDISYGHDDMRPRHGERAGGFETESAAGTSDDHCAPGLWREVFNCPGGCAE
jgi:hypothetical protein